MADLTTSLSKACSGIFISIKERSVLWLIVTPSLNWENLDRDLFLFRELFFKVSPSLVFDDLTHLQRDSAFNPLTVQLGWLCVRMTRLIRLSAHIVFLIQTAQQSLIGVPSQRVDGWDRTIKIKCWRQQTENRTLLLTIIMIFIFLKSVFKMYSPIPEVGSF